MNHVHPVTLSIGVDISKLSFAVALYDGQKFTSLEYLYDTKHIKRFINKVKHICADDTSVLVTMEATGSYFLRLAEALCAAGIPTSVMNPLVIKRYGQMKLKRAKTDKADAQLIAEYGYHEEAHYYTPPSDAEHAISVCLSGIDDVLRMRTAVSNRLEALSQHPRSCSVAENALQEIIQTLNASLKRLEREVLDISHKHFREDYERLQSIPSVGPRLAGVVIGKLRCFNLFDRAKQVSSFIGMCPRIQGSGTSMRERGRISKQGSGYIRMMFFMAALSAVRVNEPCKKLYQRQLLKGKPKKVALIAVANKLLRQIFAIVKYKRVYDPHYVSVAPHEGGDTITQIS